MGGSLGLYIVHNRRMHDVGFVVVFVDFITKRYMKLDPNRVSKNCLLHFFKMSYGLNS